MAIIQISKIQQRSGNLVDLPQLDQAQLGWANDAKRLFIGTTTPNPNENVEVLTSYSNISFSQINGSQGNLNIVAASAGQVLSYDGTNWVNKGGTAGGRINLGTVANITINGGAIGYVLETDGVGNLSWTPKSTITAYISNVTKANPGVVTTTQDNFFTDGSKITITNVSGMTELNGNSYYVNVLTSNTFSLYSDSGLSIPVDTSGYTTYTTGGRVISSVSGSGTGAAGGSNTTVQFNDNNVLQGNAGFTFNKVTGVFTAPNLAGNGSRLTNIPAANITGTINLATYATTANSVAGANVSGQVNYAATANSVAGANVSGAVSYATTANSVAGANVSGAVSYATTANSVAGANVSGQVNYAATANSVAVANVSGIGNIATINLDGNSSNILYGNGVFASAPTPGVSYGNSNVANYLPTFTGTVGATGLSTGSSSTAGTITGDWSLSSGSKLSASYADLAEYYEADFDYEPGTVLEFGGDKEVTLALDATTRVAGIVSTNPAYAMNTNCQGIAVAIALQGRVPCKVRGNIKKGDMLISAGNGFARSTLFPILGTVIGKSLENFDGIEGIIEVAVGRL
jgi:Ubiquitin-activating enzyme E1 FCCH domain